MKIAFLNPWREAAENQDFSKIRIAAVRVGHEVVHCANSAEVQACQPDFVIAAAITQPKLNDVPHYGIINAPLDRFFTNRAYFNNIVTYDGYLTIADSLEKVLRSLITGIDRDRPVSFYFTTSQRQDISCDLRALVEKHGLRITYFGTNWDKRRSLVFRKLSAATDVQICGPESSWPDINKKSYGGALPWDGSSVQERYAANGLGLCMLSEDHLRDDVISNRVFEIVSVGAIALCCDTPLIRKLFGDTVYYFDQHLPDGALAAAILGLREQIYKEPQEAIQKAARAREIFESRFASEVLFENVIRCHQEVNASRAAARRTAEASYTPLISVIIRCGSRPLTYVERAVASIAKQTYGRFEVIFVRHQELDLKPITDTRYPRIECWRIIDCPGGNRSDSLWAGLNAVTGEYFCILDDDDWWFSDHFEQLFHPLPKQPLRKFLAYSGSIAVRPEAAPIIGGGRDDRELLHFGIESLESWGSAAGAFASNSFVASRDLLNERLLMSPGMESAEDSYLILSLMAQAEPRFSYAATSVFDRSLADQSDFAQHPQRFEDELTLQLRLLGPDRPRFLPLDGWKTLSQHWERRPYVNDPQTAQSLEALLNNWVQVGSGYDRDTSHVSSESKFLDPHTGSASIHTDPEPWAYGAMLALPKPLREASDYTLAVELKVCDGKVGVGVLNREENDFLFRQLLREKPEPQIVLIPIRKLSDVGYVVIQNWETAGKCRADLLSLRLMAAPNHTTQEPHATK